jgi:hypothetical protein
MALAILVKCAKSSHLLPKEVVLPNNSSNTDSAVNNGKTGLNMKVNGWMARLTGEGPSITSMVTSTKESS